MCSREQSTDNHQHLFSSAAGDAATPRPCGFNLGQAPWTNKLLMPSPTAMTQLHLSKAGKMRTPMI
jgi:hypothetical protein